MRSDICFCHHLQFTLGALGLKRHLIPRCDLIVDRLPFGSFDNDWNFFLVTAALHRRNFEKNFEKLRMGVLLLSQS